MSFLIYKKTADSSAVLKCRRWDLNPHDIATTGTWSLRVCQFRHSCEQMIVYQMYSALSILFCNFFQIYRRRHRLTSDAFYDTNSSIILLSPSNCCVNNKLCWLVPIHFIHPSTSFFLWLLGLESYLNIPSGSSPPSSSVPCFHLRMDCLCLLHWSVPSFLKTASINFLSHWTVPPWFICSFNCLLFMM